MVAKKKSPADFESSSEPITKGFLVSCIAEQLQVFGASLNQKFAAIDEKFAAIDEKFAAIDEKFAAIDEKFALIDQKFAAIDEKFAAIDRRFAAIDEKFVAMDARFDWLRKHLEAKIDWARQDAKDHTEALVKGLDHRLSTRLDRLESEIRAVGAAVLELGKRIKIHDAEIMALKAAQSSPAQH